MKKSILILLTALISITGYSQLGDFPVSPNQGGETEAANRQRVIDGSGSYLSNIAPHQLDVLTSYGIVADNLLIPSGRKASVLYSQFPTDGTGDFVVINAAVKNEIVDGKLREIAANIAGFNYKFGYPVLEVNEATENLLEYPVSLGHTTYWTVSGATIDSDPSTKGSDQNVSSTANGDYTTFGGASATGFAATSNGGATHEAGTADEITVTASNIIRVAFTLTLNSGTAPTVALKDALAGGNIGNSKTQVATAGSNDMYFYGSSATTGVVEFSNTSTTTDFVIADLSVSEVTGFPSPSVDLPVSGFKLMESAVDEAHSCAKYAIATGNVQSTLSIKAKAGERTWIGLRDSETNGGYYFDLENGVVGNVINNTPDSYSIISLTNGWYDISITVTVTTNEVGLVVYLSSDGTDFTGYSGDGSSGAYLAFAQLEELPYASTWTFISEGSTSSRIADQINDATYSGNSTEGVMSVNIAAFADDLSDRYISLSDGSTDNAVQIYYSTTTNQIVGRLVVGTSEQAAITYTLPDETDFSVVSIRWKVNDVTLWVDGSSVGTPDVSASTFPAHGTLTEWSLDDGGGGNDYYGYFAGGFVKGEYLSDTQMRGLK